MPVPAKKVKKAVLQSSSSSSDSDSGAESGNSSSSDDDTPAEVKNSPVTEQRSRVHSSSSSSSDDDVPTAPTLTQPDSSSSSSDEEDKKTAITPKKVSTASRRRSDSVSGSSGAEDEGVSDDGEGPPALRYTIPDAFSVSSFKKQTVYWEDVAGDDTQELYLIQTGTSDVFDMDDLHKTAISIDPSSRDEVLKTVCKGDQEFKLHCWYNLTERPDLAVLLPSRADKALRVAGTVQGQLTLRQQSDVGRPREPVPVVRRTETLPQGLKRRHFAFGTGDRPTKKVKKEKKR